MRETFSGEITDGLLFADAGRRSFIVFGATPLPDEPIADEDISAATVGVDVLRRFRSAAWSSNVDWYFIIREADILLFSVKDAINGLVCRKKSWRFIEAFCDSNIK